MKVNMTVPELMLIAATRGALGIGVGLLLAPRIAASPRKAVGITLLAVGVLTTIPLAMQVFGGRSSIPEKRSSMEPTPVG